MYTSGSTGRPKGVMIEHASVGNYVTWLIKKYNINKNNSTLLLSNIAFDLVLTSLFGSLLSGNTLHVINQDLLQFPTELSLYIVKNKIGFLKTTPSLLNHIISEDSSFELLINAQTLKTIFVGGEKIDIDTVIKIKQNKGSINIINHYGPTETTIGVATKEIKKVNVPIPIGHPIANTQIYILGPDQGLVPVGVTGEI
ncbi:AMP-binding protein, partial [Mucilaginibacter sp. RCC_168]|uniref:AMP-binding protein n=1 Tax=Mucilaginibacter sp. RCC_168 TaxID=3239221 RepID=UPI00352448CF